MAKKKMDGTAISEFLKHKPRKQRTFTGKKYATRKPYRGQGR